MNKADLINEIAGKTGLTKTKTGEVINTIMDSIQTSLSKGEKVTLVGFGTFETRSRTSRKGRNPQNNKPISIPAKRVAKFRAGSSLAKSVNN